jgi:hypothetical protein
MLLGVSPFHAGWVPFGFCAVPPFPADKTTTAERHDPASKDAFETQHIGAELVSVSMSTTV